MGAALILGCLALFLLRFSGDAVFAHRLLRPIEMIALLGSAPEAFAGGLLDAYTPIPNAFYLLCNFLCALAGYEATAFTVFVLNGALVIAALYALSRELGGSRAHAICVAFLLVNTELFQLIQVGSNGSPGFAATQYWSMFGLVILAMVALLRGRLVLFALLSIGAFLAHPAQAVLAFAILFPFLCMQARTRARIAATVGAFAAAALVYYVYVRSVTSLEAFSSSEIWFQSVRLFSSGHVYPFFPGYEIFLVLFVSVLVTGLATFLHFEGRARWLLLTVLVTGVLGFALSLIFIYWAPLRIVYLLLPVRISTLLAATALVFSFTRLLALLADDEWQVAVIPAAVGLAAAATGTYSGLFLFCLLNALSVVATTQGARRRLALGLSALLVALPLALGSAEIGRHDSVLLGERGWLFPLVLLTLAVHAGRPHTPRWRLAVAALLLGALVFQTRLPTSYGWTSERAGAEQARTKLDDYLEASAWIRTHTPQGRPVLTGPLWGVPFLETTARRGSILQVDKAAWVYSSPQLMQRFLEVLAELELDLRSYASRNELVSDASRRWGELAEARLLQLARKYNASVLLVEGKRQLELPLLRDGPFFRIYALPRS